jgi:hypothetical protein
MHGRRRANPEGSSIEHDFLCARELVTELSESTVY